MYKKVTYKPFGEKAVLIEWEPKIASTILEDIIQFKAKIQSTDSFVIEDTVVGYHSLTVLFKQTIENYKQLVLDLKKLYISDSIIRKEKKTLWKIPVCYDVTFGIDLEEISEHTKLPITEIIKLHTKCTYQVYFIGFLPGFLYLGGLDSSIHIDRKATPRLNIAKGSVAIGGSQTGVYPMDSPGGWNVIGRTPISFFNTQYEEPCFAKSGDKIQFYSIHKQEFIDIEKQLKGGSFKLLKTDFYD
ncbi:5-oxoprolinase subunit PxpB [Tenacibaculum sp. TC6]|uniref:5-oxoprolinase subunit PxpB n=1 Tax=Tenacibaculum sp. TC6 TaxID=3423223 RepID=UPI003D36028C